MKNCLILCKTTTWATRLDVDYLDETSVIKQRYGNAVGKKLKQFTDYASKEEIGQVYAGGFFHFNVCTNSDGSMTGQKSLSNEERKKRIIQAWSKHLSTYPTAKVVQKRLVFSMSREFYDKLLEHGINPDAVLVRNAQEVLRSLQEKFHKGDGIGYAYGIHHDTEHLHIHVAICPRTRNGAYVGLSKPKIHQKVSGHLDQHGFLIKQFERLNKRWEEALTDPLKLWEKLQKTPANERLIFAPHLSQAKLHEYLNSRNSMASELAAQYRQICGLQAKVTEKRAALVARRNVGATLRFAGIRNPLRSVQRREQEKDIEELRSLQAQLCQLKRHYFFKYRKFNKQYATAHAKRQTVQKISNRRSL